MKDLPIGGKIAFVAPRFIDIVVHNHHCLYIKFIRALHREIKKHSGIII